MILQGGNDYMSTVILDYAKIGFFIGTGKTCHRRGNFTAAQSQAWSAEPSVSFPVILTVVDKLMIPE